jgi:hypothetical protein
VKLANFPTGLNRTAPTPTHGTPASEMPFANYRSFKRHLDNCQRFVNAPMNPSTTQSGAGRELTVPGFPKIVFFQSAPTTKNELSHALKFYVSFVV